MKKIYVIIQKHAGVFLFLFFYLLTLSYKLISAPGFFYDWDESLYIQTGREMFEHNFFLFPVWQGQPWLDKPPLIPFLYGAVMKIFYFIQPEITTRLFTLIIAVIVLIFVYMLSLKAIKEKSIAFLTVVFTAFTPIFLQRAQIVNLDVFLLLGWLGHILFFDRFWLSVFFLMISILSKSLLGFYPIAIIVFYYLYSFWIKKIKKKNLKKILLQLLLHSLIAISWFVLMLIIYKQQFFTQHIIESHFKRVTASIESHFGKRTFYVDLIIQEFGILIWLAIPGMLWLLLQLKQKRTDMRTAYSIYLLPWFVFLNLTKTKIFWYIYPVIPQFAFLSALPLMFLKKKRILYYASCIFLCLYVGYTVLITRPYLNTLYSGNDPHYPIAFYARQYQCHSLSVIENPGSRKAYDTLSRLNLVITTTNWWGSHPSIVYYYGGKVDFIYSQSTFMRKIPEIFSHKKNCIMVEWNDDVIKAEIKKKNAHMLWQYKQYQLFRPR